MNQHVAEILTGVVVKFYPVVWLLRTYFSVGEPQDLLAYPCPFGERAWRWKRSAGSAWLKPGQMSLTFLVKNLADSTHDLRTKLPIGV